MRISEALTRSSLVRVNRGTEEPQPGEFGEGCGPNCTWTDCECEFYAAKLREFFNVSDACPADVLTPEELDYVDPVEALRRIGGI